LGLCVPSSYINTITDYGYQNVRFSDTVDDWGVVIDTNELNLFFDNNRIPLKCDYHSSLTFEDWEFEDFLVEETRRNRYPIVGFDYNSLLESGNIEGAGHVVVCDSIHNGKLLAFDPGPKDAGSKVIEIYNLYVASKRKRGGIWTFQKLTELT